YNLNRGGKPMLDCVTAELKEVKDIDLIHYVSEQVLRDDIREIYESYNDKLAYRCSKKNDHAKEKNAVGNENQKSNQGSTSYDTCTISGQEEEQYKEKEKYKKQQKDVADVIQFWDENGFGINNRSEERRVGKEIDVR